MKHEGGNMRKTAGKRLAGIAFAFALATSVFAGSGITSFAYTQTTGTVTSDNVKVRSTASTTASQVSSLKNGDSVDIVDEATDSSGYVWYKIYVNKNEFGYVRSDLVSKAGGSSSTTIATNTSTTTTTSLPETTATAVEQKSATVISDSVNVRKGAGTGYDSVGKVKNGDTVTITGEANGTDGKTWYQVTFGDNSTTGYIRSDLVQISEVTQEQTENTEVTENTEGGEEQAEGENTEDQTESQDNSVSADSTTGDGTYSLYYTTDESGNGIWYLYDNVGGYRVKVNELIEAAQSADAVNGLRKTANNYKTIAIILGIGVILLVAAVIVLALKLRDSLYYEDEEEEEYDRYSASSRKRNNEEAAVSPRRNTRENSRNAENTDSDRPSRRVQENRPSRRDSDEERTIRPNRRNSEDEYENRSSRRNSDAAPSREFEERASKRNADRDYDERPVRRRDVSDDEYEAESNLRRSVRGSEERPSRRGPSARDEEPVGNSAPKRKTRNFIGDDDDFEFEFLDLDDDK